ncbi:MAG: 2-keto-3-deoxygluconate permease [Phycisphaeraceae bacterium]|nr:2-keto-3-deoxygluconate permease [Phycisphaeraceae bacterium]
MKIKRTLEKIPGGLMVVPLFAGTVLNTIDQMHLPVVQDVLRSMGTAATADGNYEFLRIGGFSEALFKGGALALIGLFLVCVGAQMSFAVGGRALKKGLIITGAKFGVAVACGFGLAALTGDPFNTILGLSMVAIIAAMANGNGGLFAALTGQYGNRSDVGSLSVISINDGPFLTLLALGLFGEQLPIMVFVAVLLPLLLGFALGNLDGDIRRFLKPGTELTIPFFAFALGANMNLMDFGNQDALVGGVVLGIATFVLTGAAATLLLRLSGERSQIAAWAEASTAGNAVQTPIAVTLAALAAVEAGFMSAERAALFAENQALATAQISISVMTTAILCPIGVIFWSRWQNRRGIDGRVEHPGREPSPSRDMTGPDGGRR